MHTGVGFDSEQGGETDTAMDKSEARGGLEVTLLHMCTQSTWKETGPGALCSRPQPQPVGVRHPNLRLEIRAIQCLRGRTDIKVVAVLYLHFDLDTLLEQKQDCQNEEAAKSCWHERLPWLAGRQTRPAQREESGVPAEPSLGSS